MQQPSIVQSRRFSPSPCFRSAHDLSEHGLSEEEATAVAAAMGRKAGAVTIRL
jgi:hypothetical protein